jgi:uncharacterized membrane protein
MRFKKHFFIFCVMAEVYLVLEVVARSFRMELVGWNGVKAWSLVGWTSLWMLPVGGLCGFLIGLLNEKTKFHMALNCLFGALIIFSIEFLSGLFFNKALDLHIWDYSSLPLSILGQVSLVYFIPWYFIVPFASWLDDLLRYGFYREGRPRGLGSYYLNIFRKTQK